MNAAQLQGMELRIAEDMVSVLDFLSRVKQGVEGGNWHYVLDKAGELARAAQRLSDAAGYEIERPRSDPPARAVVVTAAVQTWSRRYAVGRVLYPELPARFDWPCACGHASDACTKRTDGTCDG